LLTLVSAGCAYGRSSVDRRTYVQKNEVLFQGLPKFPGSRVVSQNSNPYRAGDYEPVIGYGTLFVLTLPRASTPLQIGRFFSRKLRPTWRLDSQLEHRIWNYRKGRSAVSINVENWERRMMEVFVDHESYGKLGR